MKQAEPFHCSKVSMSRLLLGITTVTSILIFAIYNGSPCGGRQTYESGRVWIACTRCEFLSRTEGFRY